jgi:nicotinate-nucleotide adenylyltransferase
MRRIGAFGGTFDPLHVAHVQIARAVVDNLALDELILIPAHRPPHKPTNVISGAYHRYAMAVLGTLDEPRLRVSTIELEAPERPYSFETVERLRASYGPDAELFFVIGADSFEEIETWREPGRLLAEANLVVISRPGHVIDQAGMGSNVPARVVDLRGQKRVPLAAKTGERTIYLTDYVHHPVSSTEIRKRVESRQSIVELVPDPVARYIEKYGLYRR